MINDTFYFRLYSRIHWSGPVAPDTGTHEGQQLKKQRGGTVGWHINQNLAKGSARTAFTINTWLAVI